MIYELMVIGTLGMPYSLARDASFYKEATIENFKPSQTSLENFYLGAIREEELLINFPKIKKEFYVPKKIGPKESFSKKNSIRKNNLCKKVCIKEIMR